MIGELTGIALRDGNLEFPNDNKIFGLGKTPDDVDLSRRRVSVYRRGRLAFSASVAVGASTTPTPVGRFYVDERFRLASANGPFGVAALGISAHSDALRDWVQGGPVALHGTDDPSSIGLAVSHGCVRLSRELSERVWDFTGRRTPVRVV